MQRPVGSLWPLVVVLVGGLTGCVPNFVDRRQPLQVAPDHGWMVRDVRFGDGGQPSDDLADCYSSSLSNGRYPTGVLELSHPLDERGRVLDTKVVRRTVASDELAACVTRVSERRTFAATSEITWLYRFGENCPEGFDCDVPGDAVVVHPRAVMWALGGALHGLAYATASIPGVAGAVAAPPGDGAAWGRIAIPVVGPFFGADAFEGGATVALAANGVAQLSGVILLILAGAWPDVSVTPTGPVEVGTAPRSLTLTW